MEKQQVSLTEFAARAVADFERKAAIRPSSRFLAQKMVRPLPLDNAKLVVELGPGKGVITRELLALMPPNSRLLAFEISPAFTRYLNRYLPDPRLEVVNACACSATELLHGRGWKRVDVVVASLGFGMMTDSKAHEIFSALTPLLDQQSVFTLFQYAHRMKLLDGHLSFFDISDLLDQHFRKVERRPIWRNFPPALVFDCRM